MQIQNCKNRSGLTGIIIALCFAILIYATACTKAKSKGEDIPPQSAATEIEIKGTVQDINGNPLGNVAVSSGDKSGVSQTDGSFSLTLNQGTEQVILFNINGYVDTSKRVSTAASSSSLKVTMIEEADPVELDATIGGTATGNRSASITAGPAAFVDSDGNTVTGKVDVHLTPLDPTNAGEAAAYPGYLKAIDKNGNNVILQTYGVMDVTVKQNGGKLSLAEGKSVSISIPLPSSIDKPDSMNMWYFDMNVGKWIQNQNDGAYDSGTRTYSTGITHLSWWNCDNPIVPTCIFGKVVDSEGNGVQAHITAQGYRTVAGTTYITGVYSYGDTDYDGNFCMIVELGEKVLLTVTYEDTTTSRVITGGQSFSQSYPADCEAESCKLIRSIEVGTPDPGEGQANCTIGDETPFDLTCAADLGELFKCFSPEGTCTYKIELGLFGDMPSYEMTFENGSKIVSDYNLFTGGLDLNYYGPGPAYTLCGSVTYNESGETMITVAKTSKQFIIRTTKSGGIELECPGGFKIQLNADQQDAFSGCTGQAGNTDTGVACEPESGSFMSECVFDAECDEGYSCCGDINDKKCMPAGMCTVYEDSCKSNIDCVALGHDLVCCSYGFFKQCVPVEACQ